MRQKGDVFIADGDKFLVTPESGTVVNISALVRIGHEVALQLKPGMSEAEVDAIIKATCKRMSPN